MVEGWSTPEQNTNQFFNFNMKHKILLLAAIATLGMAAVSCTKEQETKKAPTITKITDGVGKEITTAPVGTSINISGENLSNATKLVVDGIDLSKNFTIVKGAITCTLPEQLPETPTGKIVVENPDGSAEAPFSVFAKVAVEKMKCEYVLPGDDLTIIGKYFAANGFSTTSGKVTIGGKEAKIKSVDAESMVVTVPADAADNSQVILVSETTGTQGVKVPGLYRDNEYMIIDLELGKGAGYYLVDKGLFEIDDITPLQGNAYIHYHHWVGPKYGEKAASYNGNYVWDKLTTNTWMNHNTITAEILSNPQNYAFKFEVKTNIPNKLRYTLYWKNAAAGAFGVYWPDYDLPKDQRRDYNAEGLSDEQKKEIIMADYAATFDTKGEWVTVSIPFTQFMKHKDAEGNDVAGFDVADAGVTLSHEMAVHTEYIQTENDIYFDCFRISKID